MWLLLVFFLQAQRAFGVARNKSYLGMISQLGDAKTGSKIGSKTDVKTCVETNLKAGCGNLAGFRKEFVGGYLVGF